LQNAEAVSQLLSAGNAAFEAGDTRTASTSWKRIRECEASTPEYPKAVYNLGLLEFKEKNFQQAIGYFEEVLRSHPNDKEPGGSLMQTNRNYSFRSALGVSQCYEAMGEFRPALHWAWLAKTKYPYYSWCGTCYSNASAAVNKRIAYLAFRASRLHLWGSTLVLGVVVLRVKQSRQRKRDLTSPTGSQ
jgi:tetratricopeptide (TPR) repeat protein